MFTVLAACATAAAQAIPLTTVFQSDAWYSDGFDTSTDGTAQYITITEIVNFEGDSEGAGTGDVRYTIYDNDFEIMEQFTIKGVYVMAMYDKKGGVYTKTGPEDFHVFGYDIPDIVATKGLFTNDGKWCVIIRENDIDDPYKVVGYTVYDQDGKKVGNLPEEKGRFNYSFCHGLSGKIYLVDCKDYPYPKSLTVYSFTGQSSLASPAIIVKNVQASPNPLPTGETLTITLPREAPDGTFITFTDMRGRVVDKTHVQSGATTFTATPRSMSRGAYIYTVYFGDGEVVSGKLLAR